MPSTARTVTDIDWPSWRPGDHATLTFVRHEDQLLLIHKKRGLGAGKVNAPGGRIEAGETAHACAVREVEEELGVTPIAPRHVGRLRFQFVDGYRLQVEVFAADAHRGEAYETDEAIPLWTAIDAIPFDRMWADDHLWIPKMLAGEPFSGRFIFDDDVMLDLAFDDPPDLQL